MPIRTVVAGGSHRPRQRKWQDLLAWLADGAVVGRRAGGNWGLGWYADEESDEGYHVLGTFEAYEPPGRLVLWAAVIGAAVTAGALATFWGDEAAIDSGEAHQSGIAVVAGVPLSSRQRQRQALDGRDRLGVGR